MATYILSDKKVAGAKNLPVIKIDFLHPDISFENFDAFIFTSKNGVKAISRLFTSWKNFPSFAIGEATANTIEELGGRVSFCSSESYGEALCEEICRKYSSLRFLYLSPKITAFDFKDFLSSKSISIEQAIVYETTCDDTKQEVPEDGSVIIFSSPSTIECFFKKFSWNNTYRAIVIGKTTAKSMPTGVNFEISPEQNLSSAVKFAQTNYDNLPL